MGYSRQPLGRGSIHVACTPQGLEAMNERKIVSYINQGKEKANFPRATAVSPQRIASIYK